MKIVAAGLILMMSGIGLCSWADVEPPPSSVSSVKAYDAQVMVPLGDIQAPEVYVRLQNTGDKQVSLIAVSSSVANRVLIQEKSSGAKNPKLLQSLVLPPKTLVELSQAGPYLLLKGLKFSYQTGDQLHFQLRFSDNSQIEVVAVAKSAFDQPHHH